MTEKVVIIDIKTIVRDLDTGERIQAELVLPNPASEATRSVSIGSSSVGDKVDVLLLGTPMRDFLNGRFAGDHLTLIGNTRLARLTSALIVAPFAALIRAMNVYDMVVDRLMGDKVRTIKY